MDEAHYSEIDVVLLHIEQARARADRAAATLRRTGGDRHLIEALEHTEEQLSETGSTLMKGTFFAVPSAQTSL